MTGEATPPDGTPGNEPPLHTTLPGTPAGRPLLPGGIIGILGGGQLGRMTAMVARRMGYRVAVLDPSPDSPAGQLADRQVVARFDDLEAVTALAAQVDVMTLEFENLPASVVEVLEARLPMRPGSAALRIAQDRVKEKTFFRARGLPVADFAPVFDVPSLQQALKKIGTPSILKTATLGYDGKGQWPLSSPLEAEDAFNALGRVPCILEQRVAFNRELSVVVARDVFGHTVSYPPAENVHVGGILDTSTTPAPISAAVADEARRIALTIASELDYVGVLAVELFHTAEDRLLVNEMAPRPHNSGHWSIEACLTSQFEQQVRTVVGAPVGPTDLLRPASTANLMGDLWSEGEPRWEALLAMADVQLHLYGKSQARPGRKMGHLTALAATPEEARARVLNARFALLGG